MAEAGSHILALHLDFLGSRVVRLDLGSEADLGIDLAAEDLDSQTEEAVGGETGVVEEVREIGFDFAEVHVVLVVAAAVAVVVAEVVDVRTGIIISILQNSFIAK